VSFDLAVLSARQPLDPERAAETYARLAQGEAWDGLLRSDPRIDDFVREITRWWPQPDDVPVDEVQQCPWTIGFDVSPAHVISAIAWSRADDVAPVYIESALRHGLNVFDPQAGVLHSPGMAPRPVTHGETRPRFCSRCGQPIPPDALTAELPGRTGIFHMGCLLADWPAGQKN